MDTGGMFLSYTCYLNTQLVTHIHSCHSSSRHACYSYMHLIIQKGNGSHQLWERVADKHSSAQKLTEIIKQLVATTFYYRLYKSCKFTPQKKKDSVKGTSKHRFFFHFSPTLCFSSSCLFQLYSLKKYRLILNDEFLNFNFPYHENTDALLANRHCDCHIHFESLSFVLIWKTSYTSMSTLCSLQHNVKWPKFGTSPGVPQHMGR